MSYSDSIDIECSPEAAFAVITDLPHMDRLSPENTGGEWIGGASGPQVGAKFKGTNARDRDSWYTIAKVVTYDPPKSIRVQGHLQDVQHRPVGVCGRTRAGRLSSHRDMDRPSQRTRAQAR
jgi:hypothetical protein